MTCINYLRSALQTLGSRMLEFLSLTCLSLAVPAGILHAQAARPIFDPSINASWLLVPDQDHPAGPGKFVLADGHHSASLGSPLSSTSILKPRQVIIRANEALTLEEHTPVIDLCLEAIALGPAIEGQSLLVRLKANGHILRAMAVAHGHASLGPAPEPKP